MPEDLDRDGAGAQGGVPDGGDPQERAPDGAGATDEDPEAPQHPLPPPSGIDLARSVLAAARARSRDAATRRTASPGPRRRPVGARSGSGPDDRDPQPLSTTLRRLVADRGWEPDVAMGSVLGRWEAVVGPDLAAHVQPESFTEGVLTLRADSTAWATQVRLLTATIVARVEEATGPGSVARLVVLGPDAPSWRHGARVVKGRGPRDTYG